MKPTHLPPFLVLLGCSGGDYVRGVLTNLEGVAIEGARISVGEDETTSGVDGAFKLSTGITDGERVAVSISAENYFDTISGTLAPESGKPYLQVALPPREEVGQLDPAEGGELETEDVWISFPEDAFETTDGGEPGASVTVFAELLSPDDDLFGSAMPGGDFRAIDEDGTEGVLTSFGAVIIEAEDGEGQELQLAPGATARICQQVPASMAAQAPESIPVWVMGEDGIWIEAGSATLEGGRYCWDISQLGPHNCDLFDQTALLHGVVCDTTGAPLPFTPVSVHQYTTVTGSTGMYAAYVPSQTALTVSAGGHSVSIPPLDDDEVYQQDIGCDAQDTGEPPASGGRDYELYFEADVQIPLYKVDDSREITDRGNLETTDYHPGISEEEYDEGALLYRVYGRKESSIQMECLVPPGLVGTLSMTSSQWCDVDFLANTGPTEYWAMSNAQTTSGSLTITENTAERIAGEFEMVICTGCTSDEPHIAYLQGSFYVKPCPEWEADIDGSECSWR